MGFNMEIQTINKQAIADKITWQQVLTMVGTEYSLQSKFNATKHIFLLQIFENKS